MASLALAFLPRVAAAADTAQVAADTDITTSVIGAFFVALYTFGRFNNPPNSRSSTTALRYCIGLVVYVLTAVVVYVFCLLNVTAQKQALELFSLWGEIPAAAVPLLLALVMTSTVEGLSPLTKVDDFLRQRFQRLASIPYRARALSADLASMELRPPEPLHSKVAHELAASGFAGEDVVFGAGSSLQQLWTRVTLLLVHVKGWATSDTFANFYRSNAISIGRLDRRYSELVHQAQLSFHTERRHLSNEIPPDWSPLVDGHRLVFHRQVEALLESICDLVSRGVLECGRTERTRDRELESMGITPTHDGLTMDQRLGAFLMISGMLTLFIVVLNRHMPLDERIAIGLAASISNWIAVLWAVEPREKRWAIAQPDRPGYPPIKYYLMVALGSGTCALLIRGLARMVKYGSFTASMENAQQWAAWALVDVATAVMIAINTESRDRPWPRWFEAVSQALVTMAVAFFIWWSGMAVVSTGRDQLILRLGIFGLLLGWFVPTWFRGAPRDARDVRARDGRRALEAVDRPLGSKRAELPVQVGGTSTQNNDETPSGESQRSGERQLRATVR